MANPTPNPPSTSRLSTRISLRWIPEPAFENTDTITMSVKGWYVDLRVDKVSGEIDWAIAGQRVVESEEPLRVLFTHDIDSHNAFDATDCGEFTTLPNGDDFETGSMPRDDLPGSPVTDYEEVWRRLEFREGPEGPGRGVSWVLVSCEDTQNLSEGAERSVARTFIARIWGTYMILRQLQTLARLKDSTIVVKDGGGVSAKREEWDASVGWKAIYALGSETDKLPSMGSLDLDDKVWNVGEKVVVNGEQYIVRGFEQTL